jgi:hypothetical protein
MGIPFLICVRPGGASLSAGAFQMATGKWKLTNDNNLFLAEKPPPMIRRVAVYRYKRSRHVAQTLSRNQLPSTTARSSVDSPRATSLIG